MSITPDQCRAARAILNWSQGALSEAAGVARATIAEFEGGRRAPISNNLLAIRTALEQAGVIFLDAGATVDGGPGVRLATKE
ncbi:helix-turn-helix domain-containing protein [Camelimonas lactis]|uniref:helix-turn-helix domain-containing protein n=1 Tax=Camelimonas lactis TaxID=659006 RepID=UPI0010432707|nr:helix-turn-helix transcriptional regulator [Camelimonas lactis]